MDPISVILFIIAVILFVAIAGGITFPLLALVLAEVDICFTRVKEGTAKAIVRGENFDHFIMAWRGHYLNDPRQTWHDATKPAWEVVASTDPSEQRWVHNSLVFGFLERQFGIYWYGLWPFKEVLRYRFEWAETRVNTQTGREEAWYRREYTTYIYVADFAYWEHLPQAEEKLNITIDLDYLLTVRVNNPYKALFDATDWFEQVSAYANNIGKVWVGEHTFEELVHERGAAGSATSEFVTRLLTLNTNLITHRQPNNGMPEILGVTIRSAAIKDVQPSGGNREDIARALTARAIAEREAEAAKARATGEAEAVRIRAHGDADALRTQTAAEAEREIALAQARSKAIGLVYKRVQKFGDTGVLLQQLEAMQAASGAGTRVIWANSPFIQKTGIAPQDLQALGITPDMILDYFRNAAGRPQPPANP